MTDAGSSGTGERSPRRLQRYLAACGAVAVGVVGVVAAFGPAAGPPTLAPWLFGLLWLAVVLAGSIEVGLPVRGVGGVPETTSLLEIAAVSLMVFADPVWAIALAVTAYPVAEVVAGRREPRKIAFNTASEAMAIALGATVFHALSDAGSLPAPDAIGAALSAGGVYIAVNMATFAGLAVALSGWRPGMFTSEEMRSSVLVSAGLATTGVLLAVLAVTAPWATPLLIVPAILDHLHGRGRQASLGLGLSISRGFVEAMGGRLEVASEVGRGTTFVVVLPLTVGET
ncbi:MAG: ATP-binding protein [Nitriliruptor sp.]